MLELLLPGGTLLALSLFLYRRWKAAGGRSALAWRFTPILALKEAR